VPQPSATAGNLQVLNWAGFKAAVSYNFDDANSSQTDNYSQLKALGVPFTFYLIGNKITKSTWAPIFADGHEFANHTQDHNTVSQSNVDTGKATILSNFPSAKVTTFAAPNGWITQGASAGTPGYGQYAQPEYFIVRGVSDGLMKPGNETTPSWGNVYCYIPPMGAATSNFNTEVDGAYSGGGWRVILVHGFVGGSDSAYQPVPLQNYIDGINYTKTTYPDMWIGTMDAVGAYWRGQNAFNAAAKTMSGTSTTWTWTLPSNFPTGKYLRVTVDGGTLTQDGQTLAWDSHGYYEIALDVGSLTLSQ
jgi:peptidoglycan/xylan/chitin deacetylase (PgdA/CDA1 family)